MRICDQVLGVGFLVVVNHVLVFLGAVDAVVLEGLGGGQEGGSRDGFVWVQGDGVSDGYFDVEHLELISIRVGEPV